MSERRPLIDFFKANPPREEMYARNAAYAQRDYFERLKNVSSHIVKDAGSCEAEVIGDHMSKSVLLPVAEFAFSNGASVVLRGNFFNYALSVTSPQADVPAALLEGLASSEKIAACYCEGFPAEKVYGTHAENARQFTTKVYDAESLSFFMLSFAKLQKEAMLSAQKAAKFAPKTGAPKP